MVMPDRVPDLVRKMVDAGADAAVVLDPDRRILYYNRLYETQSGLKSRALAQKAADGAKCFEVFPLDICQTDCVGCKARDAGRALRAELIKARRGDGEELALTVTAAELPGGLILESYRDVTADVRIQRNYTALLENERRQKGELARLVDEKTDELKRTQTQLIHQEKMSSLGRLVAGIAHELNNPINFVYGNVDFLGRYMEDVLELVRAYDAGASKQEIDAVKTRIEFEFLVEDSRKLIRSIRAGAERTAGIVRDLKAFSRPVAGQMQDADVVTGIESTLNLLAPLLKGRITVHRDYADPHPQVTCHPGHINQVFMNILTNAAQAIEGEGAIFVSVKPAAEEKVVKIAVRDTGCGIAPDVIEKIFDPFFTTKDVGEGTGLGLAISETIVRAHAGAIGVTSPGPGSGSTFTITLPCRAS
jgi:two-component system NtrC family sensor kinase